MTLRHTPSRPDARLRRAIERSPEPTWLADRRGRWRWVSAAWTRLTGQSRRDALGEGWLARVEADGAKRLCRALAGLAAGEACAIELRVLRADGSRVALLFDARALDDVSEADDADSIFGRCRATTAAPMAPGPADPVTRDHVLALVSHELRSPLNGIQSWAHVLENHLAPGSDTARRALAGIRTGVAQQVRLIDGLLDATQVFGGRALLASREVPLAAAARRALAQVEGAARERGQTLVCAMPASSPVALGDAERIEQILVHLLSNAVRFSGNGAHITVAAEPVAEARGGPGAAHGADSTMAGGQVCVSVSDDGPGLPAGLLDAMFEPFNQARHAGARSAGGLGLGLSLARRLAELMGGALEAANGPRQGARFVLRLPRACAQPSTGDGAAVQPALHGMRLMLVDDQHEARESLAELLRQAGARVEALASGTEAIGVFGRLGCDDRPDVLICDIAMPELDGYATLRRIRAIERAMPASRRPAGDGRIEPADDDPLAEGVPAVALTAFTQRADRVRALLGGFHVHLAKPVDPGDLIAILSALGARHAMPVHPH